MAYITQTDVEKEIDSAELILLTDDAGSGSVGANQLTQAIADAEAIINGYLRNQHTVPITSPCNLIKKIDLDLTIYMLYKRRRTAQMDDGTRNRYDDSLALLKQIGKGEILIDDSTSFANTGGIIQSNKNSDSKVYTSSYWDTY